MPLLGQENLPLTVLMCVLVSYGIGSMPFGLWIGLLWKGIDIRTLGSKNIGATNVLRVLGPGPGITVFLLDTLKGAVGVLLAYQLGVTTQLAMPFLVLIGLCAVLGHTFSPFLRFSGGKGIATSLGVLLALGWQVGLIGLGVWIIVVSLTRFVSLASLIAALSLVFAAYFTLHGAQQTWMMGLCVLLFILVTVKHRPNIQRLLAGTEAKLGQRAPAAESPVPAGDTAPDHPVETAKEP